MGLTPNRRNVVTEARTEAMIIGPRYFVLNSPRISSMVKVMAAMGVLKAADKPDEAPAITISLRLCWGSFKR